MPSGARWVTTPTPNTSVGFAASSPAAASTCADRTFSRSFSTSRSRAVSAATRSGSSSGRTLSASVSWATSSVLAGQELVGVGADQRLDAAHAGADRRLAEELDQAELAGALRVGAAAELARPVADRDDADLVAVLLAEQRHRADVARLLLAS